MAIASWQVHESAIGVFIENPIMHDLDWESLEKAAEMCPVFLPWWRGSKRSDEVPGADGAASPSAQFARPYRCCDFIGGFFRQLALS